MSMSDMDLFYEAHMDTENETKKIINRMLIAYGVKTVKSLSELLDTTISVIGNRVARNSIPYDLIVRCSIDTGVNLRWLSNGIGEPGISEIKNTCIDLLTLPRHTLVNGKLNLFPSANIDRSLLPDEINQPEIVKENKINYIVDKRFSKVTNGKYILDIEGSIGIYDLVRVPVNKVLVSGGDLPKELELNIDDINIIAKVAIVMSEV